jgi:hypothetical protein
MEYPIAKVRLTTLGCTEDKHGGVGWGVRNIKWQVNKLINRDKIIKAPIWK